MTPRSCARAAGPLPADLAGMSPAVSPAQAVGHLLQTTNSERTMHLVIRLALPTYMAG